VQTALLGKGAMREMRKKVILRKVWGILASDTVESEALRVHNHISGIPEGCSTFKIFLILVRCGGVSYMRKQKGKP